MSDILIELEEQFLDRPQAPARCVLISLNLPQDSLGKAARLCASRGVTLSEHVAALLAGSDIRALPQFAGGDAVYHGRWGHGRVISRAHNPLQDPAWSYQCQFGSIVTRLDGDELIHAHMARLEAA